MNTVLPERASPVTPSRTRRRHQVEEGRAGALRASAVGAGQVGEPHSPLPFSRLTLWRRKGPRQARNGVGFPLPSLRWERVWVRGRYMLRSKRLPLTLALSP